MTGLEALHKLATVSCVVRKLKGTDEALVVKYKDEYDTIEKQLKALEIIKMYVEFVKVGDEYRLQLKNNLCAVIFHPVYAKYIDLLKEVLK